MIYSRDAVVISISNCFTSIFAGFVVFAFVGYLSHITGQRVDQVIQAGNINSIGLIKYVL